MKAELKGIASITAWGFVVGTALSLACGTPASPAPEETTPGVQGATPSPTAEAASRPLESLPAQPSAGVVSSAGHDPTATMFRIFSGVDHPPEDSLQALALVRDLNDKSQVRVIVEIMRFWGPSLRIAATQTLTALTGQDFRDDVSEWGGWMEWLGNRPDEYRPPDGYLGWKIDLLSNIDPRFEEFLASAEETTRIDLTELAWGGVRPDGIPDLRNAPVIPAAEADYLNKDDRVFGVSINGEHRAYPLRIMNPHEMANDALGGESIALAY